MACSPQTFAATEADSRSGFLYRNSLYALLLLAGLLVGAGFMSAWFFQQVDDSYSQLLTRTTADLRNVRDIAYHSSVAYANLMRLPQVRESGEKEELVSIITKQKEVNDKIFEGLEHSISSPGLRAALDEVKAKRLISRQEYNEFIARTDERRPLDLQSLEGRQLVAAFVDYQDACEILAAQIEAQSVRVSHETTAHVHRLRSMFFALAVFPIFLALVLVLGVVYLISVTPVEIELCEMNETLCGGTVGSDNLSEPRPLPGDLV